jgi:hypothetical protein
MFDLKPLSQKKQIMLSIQKFYLTQRHGNTFRSQEVVKFVKSDLNIKYIYSDSVLRYMRLLKEQGKIDFICTNRHDRIIEVR